MDSSTQHADLTARASGPRPTPGFVAAFFALTYVASWSCFIAAVAMSHGTEPTEPKLVAIRGFVVLVGTVAPSLVALWLTMRVSGTEGIRALLAGVLRWQVGAGFYVLAVIYMAAIKLSVALAYRVTTGSWPHFAGVPWLLIPLAIAISTPVQAGEEVGWRGYALPRMAERMGFGFASVVLGVIWAAWHLPLFFLPGADTYGQSFPVWTLQVTAISVAMGWVYAKTNGSLLLTMLMHSSINQTGGIVPGAVPNATDVFSLHASRVAWLTMAFLWILAGYFLMRMPRKAVGSPEAL